MSKKKRLLKKLRKLGKAQGVGPGSSSAGRSTMPSDTAEAEEHRDPMDGAAAIPPVTDAMMDHAAHEAAALADGVARDTIAAPMSPGSAAEPTMDATERAVAATIDAAVDATDAAVEEAAAAADRLARDAAAAAERTAEAVQNGSSAAVDALTRYNAKVLDMMRANAASTTALFAALVQAKSVPEAMSINADHLRRQMETLANQGRELATLAQTVALDALQPFKARPDR